MSYQVEINEILEDLNSEWDRLSSNYASLERGELFRDDENPAYQFILDIWNELYEIAPGIASEWVAKDVPVFDRNDDGIQLYTLDDLGRFQWGEDNG